MYATIYIVVRTKHNCFVYVYVCLFVRLFVCLFFVTVAVVVLVFFF